MNGKKCARILTAVLAFVMLAVCLVGCGENLNKSYEALDTALAEQPLVVVGYQRDEWKQDGNRGYLLKPILQNNSTKTIQSVVLAIATWDENGQEVKITYWDGATAKTNVAEVAYNNCQLQPGDTYGAKTGLALSGDSATPERIQAIPVKWTYTDGQTVENSQYKYWKHKYQSKQNTRADLAEPQFPEKIELTEEELILQLQEQALAVSSCEITTWEEGDLLCATVKNNGGATIETFLVAFATFDAEGNPVNITWSNGEKAENNIVHLRMKDLALAPGGEYGSGKGIGLHADSPKVENFVAIAYYYEDIDGNVWENPLYKTWLEQYEAE